MATLCIEIDKRLRSDSILLRFAESVLPVDCGSKFTKKIMSEFKGNILPYKSGANGSLCFQFLDPHINQSEVMDKLKEIFDGFNIIGKSGMANNPHEEVPTIYIGPKTYATAIRNEIDNNKKPEI